MYTYIINNIFIYFHRDNVIKAKEMLKYKPRGSWILVTASEYEKCSYKKYKNIKKKK